MRKRIDWIDFLKGFLILTVMLGHTEGCPKILKVYIYSFHMPLFFFLAGYTMSIKNYTLNEFVIKKVKSLIIPGISLGTISLIYEIIFLKINRISIKSAILGLLFQMRGQGMAIAWFLVCLFVCQVMLYIIIIKFKNQFKIIFGVSILSYIYTRIGKMYLPTVVLPYSLDIVGIAMLFVYYGYYCKDKDINIKNNRLLYMIGFFGISLLTCFLNYYLFGFNVDIYSDSFGSYLLFNISALSGINAFVMLFKKIRKARILKYIGYNSLIYYVLHTIYFETLDIICDKLSITKNSVMISIAYIVITAILIMPLVYFINKYFPYILGKERKNREEEICVHKIQ